MQEIQLKSSKLYLFEGEESVTINPCFKRVSDYFTTKTKNKRMASRKDFSPGDFKDLLPYIIILDVVEGKEGDEKEFIIRVMGTELTHIFGEQTGKNISLLNNFEVSERVDFMANHCLKIKTPISSKAPSLTFEKNHLKASFLYYPLSGDEESVDKIMIFGYFDP